MDEDARASEEIEDLKEELERFQQEKERVRLIVGQIGGIPTGNTKVINFIFTVSIAVLLIVSFIVGEKYSALMIEIAIVALSLKIVMLIHLQSKVNHFQLWVMSSIEWRMNEMMKTINKIKKSMPDS